MSEASRAGSPFVRDAIRAMSAYTLEPRTAEHKLDQNESPFDFPEPLKRRVLDRVAAQPWNRYPDFEILRIREAIASRHGFSTDEVFAGNGSNELLLATLTTLVGPGTDVVLPSPSFSLYSKIVTILGGRVRPVRIDPATGVLPVAAMIRAIEEGEGPALAIVCSPNNPTGGSLREGELAKLLETGAFVLLDRAYGDFQPDRIPPLHERLVTLSTFSKAWGLAGLRVGWLASTAANCREIRKVKLPYNLNIVSEEAALVALEEENLREAHVNHVIVERARISTELASIPGVRPYPSKANFVTFALDRSPTSVFESLAVAGTLVRDVSGYESLSDALRVSIGTRAENDRFVERLRSIMEDGRENSGAVSGAPLTPDPSPAGRGESPPGPSQPEKEGKDDD